MLRLYTHPACLEHDPGPEHPESPSRLRAVLRALDHDRFAALDRIEAPRATREQALEKHAQYYANRLAHYARKAPYNWFNFYDYWRKNS